MKQNPMKSLLMVVLLAGALAAGSPATAADTARVWRVESGQPQTPPLHGGNILHLDFSDDGRLLTVGDFVPYGARMWNAQSGEALTGCLSHSTRHVCGRLSLDGCRIVTGSYDGTARIWDAVAGTCVAPTLRHGNSVVFVDFDHTGRWLLTIGHDETVRIWDAEKLESVAQFTSPKQPRSISWSSDDRQLAVADYEDACSHLRWYGILEPDGSPTATFRAVAELANLRAAAEALHLTHSAVSQQIRGLEEQLGFPLFDRRGRRVVLNAGGEALLRSVNGKEENYCTACFTGKYII